MADSAVNGRGNAIGAYMAVTVAYWAFMLTDGALRMLVLLHFHQLGLHPIQLAYLFLLYELMGVVTNLSGGWIAARFGLTRTLYAGLAIQILALLGLTQLDSAWDVAASVAFVMAAQGLSGVAKDLTKMSAKSAVKHLAPAGDANGRTSQLFKWTAALTGSKNAVKGLGFLLGAALLSLIGFEAAILGMAGILALILTATATFMPAGLPTGKKTAKFSEVFSKDPNINRLSAARFFLFGARDVWFVVGIPIYFHAVFSDGTPEGARQSFFLVGGFMAVWIIGYGAVQAAAPRILRANTKSLSGIVGMVRLWSWLLTAIPFTLAAAAWAAVDTDAASAWLTATLIFGLLAFGGAFALNSALHSYLILAFSKAERVTMDVGFYYMSNAAGRLAGTLLSGLSYQLGGLPLCLAIAGVMALLSAAMAGALTRKLAVV